MEFAIKDLIEARKLFNELSDKIYAIAEGDLDNSKYANIYQNFEKAVLDRAIGRTPHLEGFLTKYFGSIILDFADNGFTTFAIDSEQFEIATIGSLASFLWDNEFEEIEYIERS